jgi:ribonuclease P protein component
VLPRIIKKRLEFVKIGHIGARTKGKFVIIICALNEAGDTRVGYTASKKVGSAVKRNKTKRRLRSLVRENFVYIPSGYFFVFIATEETASCNFHDLKEDFLRCVQKATEKARIATTYPTDKYVNYKLINGIKNINKKIDSDTK